LEPFGTKEKYCHIAHPNPHFSFATQNILISKGYFPRFLHFFSFY